MRKLVSSILFLALFISCGETKKNEAQKETKEVSKKEKLQAKHYPVQITAHF